MVFGDPVGGWQESTYTWSVGIIGVVYNSTHFCIGTVVISRVEKSARGRQ